MLDHTRKTAIAKCEGVSGEDARRAPLPTSPMMTIGGVVSHLRWVERDWIATRLLGGPDEGPWTDEDPDREFHFDLGRPLPEVIADWVAQSRAYDEMIAGFDLDMVAVTPLRGGEKVTLRWILHHLVEENARHNGHLDILREMADGVRGY